MKTMKTIHPLKSLTFIICLFGLSASIALADKSPSAEKGDGGAAQLQTRKVTFAGGCFWCMEKPFDEVPGVQSTTSGYMGGKENNPTYKEVSAGITGHAEVVQVLYDPTQVSFETLLEVFWRNIDPLTKNKQFCDAGTQYRSGIFFHSDEQRVLAEKSKRELEKSNRFSEPIVTEITKASQFYPAEEYHQDYYKKNPIQYKAYRYGCGRDKDLERIWGTN